MSWRRVGLAAILALAAALRLWRLDQNGFGNEYYTAGVRSMSAGWHNFLYHAFDPAGFVSVDKPPGAMWIQVLSVKLFGFHGLSVLVPQVLEGLAAVWLLHHLVQRRFGVGAGLLAALFLAVTPVSVAVDRSSNTESCLVLVLLLAAWALTRAAEEGSRRFLLLAAVLVGVAFNVKMLAAFVVLPTFALVSFMGASPRPWRRLLDASIAALVLASVSLSWVALYDITPPQKRPYAGTTDTNSALELAVGPYGIGRFVRQTRPSVVTAVASARAVTPPAPASGEAGVGPRYGFSRAFVGTPAGPLRLIDGQLAGQVLWLLPLAVAGVILGAQGEKVRRPLAPAHLALLLWSGWALTYGVVYSAAGGIFHFYYMSALAPPLAALAGIGAACLVRLSIAGGWRAAIVAVAMLVTAGWQLFIDARALDGFDGWYARLHDALVAGTLVGASGLIAFARPSVWGRATRSLAACAVGVGLASVLVIPVAWAMSSVLVPGRGTLPSADLARLLPDDAATRRTSDTTAMVSPLIAFLTANRREETFLLAASSATLAAPIIVRTGQPVMARGGFHGLDPILTPQKLADMAAARQVRFVMLGDLSGISRRMGAEVAQRPIAEWILANGRLVDPALWNGANALGGQMRLYDLRPDTPLAPALSSQ